MEMETASIRVDDQCGLPSTALADFTRLLQVCANLVALGRCLHEILIVPDTDFASTIESLTGEPYRLDFQRRRVLAFSMRRAKAFSNILLIRRSFFELLQFKPLEQLTLLIEELYFCRFFSQTTQRLGSPRDRHSFQQIIEPFTSRIKNTFADPATDGTTLRFWDITAAIDARTAEID
jgi:hypothetical protein